MIERTGGSSILTMNMEVLKFGGSSLASSAAFQRVGDVLTARKKTQRVVVCSAMGGITNALLELGASAATGQALFHEPLSRIRKRHLDVCVELGLNEHVPSVEKELIQMLEELEEFCRGLNLLGEFSPKSADFVISFGERFAVALVSAHLNQCGLTVRRIDARKWICTDGQHGNADVQMDASISAIVKGVEDDLDFDVLVTEGFIGKAPDGSTTTLGRGGSDYTASLIARAIQANCMEKSTDVPGMLTADPRVVPAARIIETMSYEEAMELCHFGAKVIYHPTIAPLKEAGIPLIVRSTFTSDHPGTLIVSEPKEKSVVRGLSSVSDISLITLEGGVAIGRSGFSRRVFSALSQRQVNVIFITQSSSEQSITIGVSDQDLDQAVASLQEELEADLVLGRLSPIRIDSSLSIVALVGEGMAAEIGVSGKAFKALGDQAINIRAIAQGSTENNISIVLNNADVNSALRALHRVFFEPPTRRLNLFCAGVGQVGSSLLDQLQAAQARLLEEDVELRLVGVANSTMYHLDEAGIPYDAWQLSLESGKPMASIEAAQEAFSAMGLHGSVWVDNTASADVAGLTLRNLDSGISVVASNKIAASGLQLDWERLVAKDHPKNARFYNETNVGAALPIIETLRQLKRSGDRIVRMEAVLSGSVNFICNRMVDGDSFEDAVALAKTKGFTEPDPRLDLGGVDVARKLLILAREAGDSVELDDIENQKFLPLEAFEISLEEFMRNLKTWGQSFQKEFDEAQAQGMRLRFVATWEPGTCHIAMRRLASDHPFYGLQQADNALAISTDRYAKMPLVIQGSGAGADLTASGVFNDLYKLLSVI